MVQHHVRRGDRCAVEGLARHRRGRSRVVVCAHGFGQDARGLSLGDRSPGRRTPAERVHLSGVHLAAEGPGGRRREEPPSAHPWFAARRRAVGRGISRTHRRRPNGRQFRHGATAVGGPPARHPDHHPRIALSDAHQRGPRHTSDGHHRHHRRDPRRRGHQAGVASRRLARTARTPRRASAAADRAVGHATAAVRDCGVPRWEPCRSRFGRGARPPAGHDRRRRHPQATRHRGDRSGRRHVARPTRVAQHLAGHPSTAAGAHRGAPLNHRLRQRPATGGAIVESAERTGGVRRSGPRPSRVAQSAPAVAHRGRPEVGSPPRAGRDQLARTRYRHGGGRSGRAGRLAGIGRQRSAAGRSSRPPGRGREPGSILPQAPGRSARDRGGGPANVRRRDRVDAVCAQSARRAGAADRGHVRPR